MYPDPEFRARFASAYALRTTLLRCIRPADYSGLRGSADAIAYSSEGITWRDRLDAELGLSPDEVATAVLMNLGHQELFVDVMSSDLDSILQALERDVLDTRLRLPWLYGRTLYDKYFNEVGQQRGSLTPAETGTLLEDTPQGVFQLGSLVIGPLGIVVSASLRSMEPTRLAALWNCSDLSCRRLHTVRLDGFESEIDRAAERMRDACELDQGPASDWHVYFWHLSRSPEYVLDDMSAADLPEFLGYALTEAERQSLLAAQLRSDDFRSSIDEQLPELDLDRPPESIATSLNESSVFQLLLLGTDESLVESLDSLIDNNDISVPPTEIRSNPLVLTRGRRTHPVRAEASVNGTRFVPRSFPIGVNRFRRLIQRVYDDPQSGHELEWKLRGRPRSNNERTARQLSDA
jgi:hypothetical protein